MMPRPSQPSKLWMLWTNGFKGLFAALFQLLQLLFYGATIICALLFSLALFCFLLAIWIFGIKVQTVKWLISDHLYLHPILY